ncbi:hypothetical protein ACTXKL_07225 [Brachybacterium tyrofermentans]|uniref:hypothetical protein n=1 Tax=Brachybacterium tyrofermentans TaxID=47848 RepID=UPI003FD63915
MNTETSPREHPRAASIESGTGTALETWVQRITEAGGPDLDHAAIARLLPERWDITEWWAQGVTVAYEQVIGRRVVGQSCDGDFSASASRTVPGDIDAVRDRWATFMTPARREQLGLEEPRLSDTATWRYWRAAVADGSRISVNITAKSSPAGRTSTGPRSTLGIEHKGLETATGRDAWKAAWSRTLADFTTSPDDLLKETR